MDGYSYSYSYLCEMAGIKHEEDSIKNPPDVWAKIIIHACKNRDEKDILDFCECNRIKTGLIGSDPIKKSYIIRDYSKKNKTVFEVDESKFDETNPFYGQKVVFTGTLSLMQRDEAIQHVLNVGGECPSGVSKTTNFLVVGIQSPSQVGPDGLSSKQKKAIKLKEEGGDIEILSEAEFIEMMGLEDLIEWRKWVDDFTSNLLSLKK